MGDDLEEGESFACAQMHREALLSEETTHANVGRPEHAACVQKQSWMGDDISQIHWTQTQKASLPVPSCCTGTAKPLQAPELGRGTVDMVLGRQVR